MPTEPQSQQNSDKEKGDAFLKEYGELVQKHQMDIAPVPTLVPQENGTTWVIMVRSEVINLKDRPIKSPFVAQ